ncbi:MAG: exo-beta-N-acetylmuramidase NamZ domain-containing protein [Gemmatimonadaceae bacterium]
MRLVAFALALSAVNACAQTPHSMAPAVRSGVDALAASTPPVLRGKRVGLITNQTGIDRDRRTTIDVMARATDYRLVALFSPEHGIRGMAQDGARIDSSHDSSTGLPIYSLYGATSKPTPAMLDSVDALVFDMQDVGVRQYTYTSTLAKSMQAAAEKGIPFVVLDRPDAVTGEIIEGGILDTAFRSFVGLYPIPSRYGLTLGELAGYLNETFHFGTNLTVLRVSGWRRDMWLDETGLPFVAPSPNLPRMEAIVSYPGTVYIEGTNLSEGRGTEFPFEQVGAPWLNADSVARLMNSRALPGVRFESVHYTPRASAAKYGGVPLNGVRFIVTDRATYRPIVTTLLLIDAVRTLHPTQFAWTGTIDRLAGTDQLRKAIESNALPALLLQWQQESASFAAARKPFLLY